MIFKDSINKKIPAQISTKILKIMTPNPWNTSIMNPIIT